LHGLRWRPQGRAGDAAPAGTWVVVGADAAARAALGEALERAGGLAVLLDAAAAPAEVAAVLAGSTAARAPIRGVAYVARAERDASAGDATVVSTAGADVVDALGLVQALAGAGLRDHPRLVFVTCGASLVVPGDVPGVAHGPLAGLARVVALEHPELRPKRVDVPEHGPPWWAELVAELGADDDEGEVALHAAGRHVARLARAAPADVFAPPPAVRADATYLVTGGLGALGQIVARWLVERGARHLVLLGRRGRDEASAATLAALEAAGATVRVGAVDVADPAALASVLADVAATAPPLGGVVHAAGVLDDGVLLNLDRERVARVLAPKVAGAWNLHRLTAGAALDFFVLFSSAASLVGSPGQGSYAAANAFLDALALHRRARGLPATSIGWGPWADLGMAGGAAAGRRALRGVEPLDPALALETLGRLLASPRAHVGVVHLAARQWAQLFPAAAAAPYFAELAPAPVRRDGSLSRALAALADDTARQARLRDVLRQEIASALQREVDEITMEAPLRDLGFDSLMAVELRNRLEVALDVTLPSTVVFSHPCASALAAALAAYLGYGEATLEPPAAEETLEDVLARIEALPDAAAEACP
jgi:myxalamid-type polyketide synthase MxaC